MNNYTLIVALFLSAALQASVARPFETEGCKPTPAAPAGPFIQTAGVIEKGTELCSEEYSPTGEATPAGERVELSGFVLDEDCKTAITPRKRNVQLLVWQADANGVYDDHEDERTHYCRGWMTVANDGSYRVNTVLPGYYPGRPRHFHILISAEGYETLVTQLYFKDDPRLNKDGNNCCKEELQELWMQEKNRKKGKVPDRRMSFNFYLKRSESWEP